MQEIKVQAGQTVRVQTGTVPLSALMARADCHLLSGSVDLSVTELTADSRTVSPGVLFAALPGMQADGRTYIPAALKAGASALLVPQGTSLENIPPTITVLATARPRLALSHMAAAFFGAQPRTIAAVTGTNGKTSTAAFAQQMWTRLGHCAASLGTLGLSAPGVHSVQYRDPGHVTTPDPVSLHRLLADLVDHGVSHLCLEASSHGLDQFRLDGAILSAAAVTNITRDHLDYHRTYDAYRAAKTRLITDVLPAGQTAVLNADIGEYLSLKRAAENTGRRVISYGYAGEDLRLEQQIPSVHGQTLHVRVMNHHFVIHLPLVGGFQAANALAALGLVLACGADVEPAITTLEHVSGVPGRLEKVATHDGAAIYVDYAHTPDALKAVLSALRPHTEGRLIVVFGCGGDRDAGKRPQMGAIAARLADRIIVTDDNPRHEEPTSIRRAILHACPHATDIGDRRQAIAQAIDALRSGDVLLIAGKGHESGQIIGDHRVPFDDREEVRRTLDGTSPLAEGGATS